MSKLFATLLVVFFIQYANAQQAAFYNDIQNFKKQDSLQSPPQHAILFVGSSSFTKWTDVQDYFPGTTIINRGFGGSCLPDVIRYAKDIIYPYHPDQVVIYCGENDFAASEAITPQIVIARVKQLFLMIRKKLPNTNIAYISIKPSPSRIKLVSKEKIANKAIKLFLAKQKNASFIDVFPLMLNEDKKPISSIFLSDSLHMNANGYAIWKKAIDPYLIKK
ncbi:MAG: G-D-S-L family lipolytic protein [Bacteroidetes bacterium]|nr:G-D-S-L family lipolytic protein [Bacteroidota bacterium]